MKVIFTLGHPAHFHLYKHTINNLKQKGNQILIVISDKDILKKILDNSGFKYQIIAKSKPNEGLLGKAKKLSFSSIELFKICKKFKPNLMVGCLSQMGVVGKILRIPTIFNAEDDASYTYLQAILTYPFINAVLAPNETDIGVFKRKKIGYSGFHKLAYLHQNFFKPDQTIVENAIGTKPFVLIRIVNLNAYHDIQAKGISERVLDKLIEIISVKYNVFISAEKKLASKYEKYMLKIDPIHVHHFLFNAQFFIGDSQSMTVESAMLGVPNIKFNSFAGRINVLEVLEKTYGLTIGINPKDEDKLFDKVNEFMMHKNLKEEYQMRRFKMLKDKIDVTAFFTWFIENYPKSSSLMKDNNAYQDKFK